MIASTGFGMSTEWDAQGYSARDDGGISGGVERQGVLESDTDPLERNFRELWCECVRLAVEDFRLLVKRGRVEPHPTRWAHIPDDQLVRRLVDPRKGYLSAVPFWKGKRKRTVSSEGGSLLGVQEARDLIAFLRPGGMLEMMLEPLGMEDLADTIRRKCWEIPETKFFNSVLQKGR